MLHISSREVASTMYKGVTNMLQSKWMLCFFHHMECAACFVTSSLVFTFRYVFCFPCIYEYIRTHNCCPVTGYPAKTEHLIKIYLPDS
ncbi:hypothetical protein BaRGS_00028793 [Batillaria attramentaria]|uniref:Peroxisome assembly protein 12 n=1 Tax=Batillaria attramentaria TaxID=370345 RepID=A0ABD0JYW4_9CAEN